VKTVISRGKGHSVVNSAAYIARAKFKDNELGNTFDHTKNQSLALFSQVIVPPSVPTWFADPEQLWNEVQRFESRKNSQFARSIELNLPHQLQVDDMIDVLICYIEKEFLSNQMIAHVALHSPSEHGGDERNYHAHLLLTLRRANEQGFYGNKVREWNDKSKLKQWRESWAIECSIMLRQRGLKKEVDRWRYGHLTLKEQYEKAIKRGDIEYAEQACNHVPTRHKGVAICNIERKGEKSYVLEARREDAKAIKKAKEIELQRLKDQEKELKINHRVDTLMAARAMARLNNDKHRER